MNAHIFIDADNIKPEIGFQAIENFSRKYFISGVEIIGNELNLSSKYLEASDRYNIKNCFYGKNSADTWLCTEIAKTIFENPEVDIIIIISSDRDFLAAIKLVTDQNKKIIFVSDGNGHKNLKALLYDLRISPDFIELVDFKNLTVTAEAEKKKGDNNSMEKISAAYHLNKVRAILKRNLPLPVKKFFKKNEAKIQFIKVKNGGRTSEIPFFDGVNFSTLANILIALRIITKGKMLTKIIEENRLKIASNDIYFEDTEISTPENNSTPEKNSFDDVIKYFVAHVAETKNIFIKRGTDLKEIPFINGISLDMFSRLLKGYEIADNAEDIKKIIADSFLDLRDNRIYFHSEEIISDVLESYLEKIPPKTLEFILQNEDKLKIVSIAYNDKVHKVPFVEGIHLSLFVNMLRALEVIGKNTSSPKVLVANGFTITESLVYKNK